MKALKNFRNFLNESAQVLSQEQIEILDKLREKPSRIQKWSQDSSGLVNVVGDLRAHFDAWTSLPVKFGKIHGTFDVSECENLISLEGCPYETIGDFDISNCYKLKSLKNSPKKIGGDFIAIDSGLTSLEHFPEHVEGDVYLNYCRNLTSIQGISNTMKNLKIWGSHITSLAGFVLSPKIKLDLDANDLINDEEMEILDSDELYHAWLKSCLDIRDFIKKYRGKIKGGKFGI